MAYPFDNDDKMILSTMIPEIKKTQPEIKNVVAEIEKKTGVPREQFTKVSKEEKESILKHVRNVGPYSGGRVLFHPDMLREVYDIKENKGNMAKIAYTTAVFGGSFTPADKVLDAMELQMGIVTGDEKLLGEAAFGFADPGDYTKAVGRLTGVLADFKDQFDSKGVFQDTAKAYDDVMTEAGKRFKKDILDPVLGTEMTSY